MALNTFADLKSSVAAYLQRDDLTLQIPTFIELATARLSDLLRVPEMESVVTTTTSTEYTALPPDFRAVRMMATENKPMDYLTPFQLQQMAQRNYRPPVPVYTIQDMQFRVYPAPTALAVTLSYYAAIPQFTTETSTNWLLTKRPDVYLRAAAVEAREFLHDDARLIRAEQFVQQYIAEANRAARRVAHGSTPMTIKVS